MTDFTKPVEIRTSDGYLNFRVYEEMDACVAGCYWDKSGEWMVGKWSKGIAIFRNKPEPKRRVPFTLDTIPLDHWYRQREGEEYRRRITAVRDNGVELAFTFFNFARLMNEFQHSPHPNAAESEWLECSTETP